MKNQYISIDLAGDKDKTSYVCNDCGAYSLKSKKDVKHYDSCKPGEGKFWEKFYGKANEEERNERPEAK